MPKLVRTLTVAMIAMVMTVPAVSGAGPVRTARSIEQAASALLDEVLPVLGIEITNPDLIEELGYEIQYSIDALIIRAETVDDLDLEVLDEELPDEDLFGDDQDDEIIDLEDDPVDVGDGTESTTEDTTPESAPAPLEAELGARLRERFRTHLTAQTAYWGIVSSIWSSASNLAASTMESCISAAQSDEDEDICYFNELQTLQFMFAQRLADNVATHDEAATRAGAAAASLLSESRERMTESITDIAEFLSDEEIAQFGATREGLTQIASVLGAASIEPDGDQ